MEVLDVILGSFLSVGLTYAFVRWDRLHMPALWKCRGWNEASTGAAVFAFSPMCIIAHFWVTRRSVWGLVKGVLTLALLIVTQAELTMISQDSGVHALLITLIQPVAIPAFSAAFASRTSAELDAQPGGPVNHSRARSMLAATTPAPAGARATSAARTGTR